MTSSIETAFVLAAGRGERLRPMTDTTPKPLLRVRGKPILEWIFENLEVLNLKRVVLNAWHLKDQIRSFAKEAQKRFSFEILVSEEESLLGTGGGLKKALPLIGEAPFLMMNGDCLWRGDLLHFVSQSLKQKNEIATWWLNLDTSEQTRIGEAAKQIVEIGNLWSHPSLRPTSFGCFTGIELIKEIDPSRLPDEGCILRQYFLKALADGKVIGTHAKDLQFWSDMGTPERLAAMDGSENLI